MKCDWTRGRTIIALVYTQTEVKHRETETQRKT